MPRLFEKELVLLIPSPGEVHLVQWKLKTLHARFKIIFLLYHRCWKGSYCTGGFIFWPLLIRNITSPISIPIVVHTVLHQNTPFRCERCNKTCITALFCPRTVHNIDHYLQQTNLSAIDITGTFLISQSMCQCVSMARNKYTIKTLKHGVVQ